MKANADLEPLFYEMGVDVSSTAYTTFTHTLVHTSTHIHTMRAELIGHFKACVTEIYLHIDARMAYYIRTHPYTR